MEIVIKAFESFVHSANFGGLHPNDEERFYKFIITSFKEDIKLDYDKFIEIIRSKASGLDEEKLREYYGRYERGLDLVRVCKTGSMFRN